MTSLLLVALALIAEPQDTLIRVFGREMVGLHDREDVIRGTCDGRPASATIIKAYRGRAGNIVLRAGRWASALPPNFLHGALLSSGFQSLGLACDGQRLQLHALALHQNAEGELVTEIQNAILDLRTGRIEVTELRTLSPAETRSEMGAR